VPIRTPVACTGLPARAVRALTCLLLVAFALIAAPSAHAQSFGDPGSVFLPGLPPAGTGSISGHVSDGDGHGVPNMCVSAIDFDVFAFAGPVTTDAHGDYTLDGLADGSYTLSFQPCSFDDDHVAQYPTDTVTVSGGGSATAPDVAMPLGGEITGSVVDSDGNGIAFADLQAGSADSTTTTDGRYIIHGVATGTYTVEVYHVLDGNWVPGSVAGVVVNAGQTTDADPITLHQGAAITGHVDDGASPTPNPLSAICVSAYPAGGPTDGMPAGFGFTGPDGSYTIQGLPGDDYAVQFTDCGGAGWLTQSKTVTATAGGDPAVADVHLQQGGTIEGDVQGGDPAQPLSDICVGAQSAGDSSSTGFDMTVDGHYRITGLPTGDYTLRFSDCGETSTWIQQTLAAQHVGAGGDAVVDPVTLVRGATVSGKVSGPNGPAGGACAYVEPVGPVLAGGTGEVGATTGDYSISGLAPGNYTLHFGPCWDSGANWLEQWYDGASGRSTATQFALGAGETKTVNTTVTPGATISGTVTAGGKAIAGACVSASRVGGGSDGFTRSNADGTYTVGGLTEGSYQVFFSDCSTTSGPSKWLSEWYDDAHDPTSVTPVALTAGGAKPGIDADLDLGGTITGHVYAGDGTGTPLGGLCVAAEDADGGVQTMDVTGADGAYDITVPAGTWKVHFLTADCFTGMGVGYRDQYASADAVIAGSDSQTRDGHLVADSTAPQPRITSGPSGTTSATSATFTFAADEPGVTFECRVDGGDAMPCSSPTTLPADAGPHTFSVIATDSAGNHATTPAQSWTVDTAATSESTKGSAAPGGTVTSDPAGNGPTASNPVVADITTPTGGDVSVTSNAAPTGTAPTGWSFFGRELQITAPPATAAADPLRLVFTVAASSLTGIDKNTVTVFRDGSPAADCTTPGTLAPDPCVTSREVLANGDLKLTVLSMHASKWNLGRSEPAGGGTTTTPTGGGTTTPAGGTTNPTNPTTGTTPTTIGSAQATTPAQSPSHAPTAPSSTTPATKPAPVKPSVTCVVPSLRNKTLAQARKALATAHCALGKVTKKADRKVKKGRVSKQAKKTGTKLPAGTKITLVLSKGRR
jgi:Carboxypeptidase regulatory-like domain/PASTA domain